tara:strand:- start:23602 stop:24087 length:486 start_codon:yes stop_codon:yes gene_type:complete
MKQLNTLFLLVILFGCNTNSTLENLENSKISVDYPAGWNTVKEDDLGDKGYYIELEKLSVPGTKLIIGILEDVVLEELLSSVQLSLESKLNYENANLTLKKATNWNTDEEENILQSFYFDQLGESFHGLIYCYKANEKSIAIIKQEAFADRYLNAPEFNIM